MNEKESEQIIKIIDRLLENFGSFWPSNIPDQEKLEVAQRVATMLGAIHKVCTPLDFEQLNAFSTVDFLEEIVNISSNFDPSTGHLSGGYVPRIMLNQNQNQNQTLH
jgi:hypothetical protein